MQNKAIPFKGWHLGKYDLKNRIWNWTDTRSDEHMGYAGATAYDPVSKKVIIYGRAPNAGAARLLTFDPETDQIEFQRHAPYAGLDNNLVYFPSNDKFYLIRRSQVVNGVKTENAVFEITLNRTDFSQSEIKILTTTGTPYINADKSVTSGWNYDPDQKVIAGSYRDNRFYYFDPMKSSWGSVPISIQVGGRPLTAGLSHHADYDPEHRVWVFINGDQPKSTWVFRFQK